MSKCPDHPHCCRPETSLAWDELGARLRKRGLKLTAPRKAILEALRNHHHPISVQELHGRLPQGVCDLATAYRLMRSLEQSDLVRSYDFGDKVTRFELLREASEAHHHHLVCVRCSGVVEIEECTITDLEQALACRHGFKAVSHRLEFFGICPGCQDGESPPSQK